MMQLASQEWRELKRTLAAGSAPAGVFLVLGPSEAVAVQAQALLQERSRRGCAASYFLSSGSGAFQVPCFWPFPGKQPAPEELDIQRLHQANSRLNRNQTMLDVLKQLEPTAPGAQGPPQLVLLEYLTPPTEHDLAFALLLLKSALPQQHALVLLIHQKRTPVRQARPDSQVVENLLCLLYMSGGRLRQADWETLLAHFPERGTMERFIACRQAAGEMWMCYADRQVAELSEALFQRMEPGRRHELARDWLGLLPHDTGYPLLAIAAETNDLEAMHSVYSQETVQAAFAAPQGLERYYARLQQLAHTAGEASLSDQAELLSLTAQILLRETDAVEVFQRLHGVLPGAIDVTTAWFFWSLLGQVLVHSDRPVDWEYASQCHQLCLEYAKQVEQKDVPQLLAGIANAEALVAYKRRQAEQARDLEEFALAQLQRRAGTLPTQVHVRTNLGDLYLRLLGDVPSARSQYSEALLDLSKINEQFTQQLTPAVYLLYTHALKQRAALSLGNAHIQAGYYTEATQLLEGLLKDLHVAPGVNRVGEAHAKDVLKTRLALAQASLKAGQARNAALCYWRILRHPRWLEPLALREVEAKLRDCRPAMHERLHRRMDCIVSEQETIIDNAKRVMDMLLSYTIDSLFETNERDKADQGDKGEDCSQVHQAIEAPDLGKDTSQAITEQLAKAQKHRIKPHQQSAILCDLFRDIGEIGQGGGREAAFGEDADGEQRYP
jgi:hypothetical protein